MGLVGLCRCGVDSASRCWFSVESPPATADRCLPADRSCGRGAAVDCIGCT